MCFFEESLIIFCHFGVSNVTLFLEWLLNTEEKSSGKKPLSLGNSSNGSQHEMTVEVIISVYKNHPIIRKIKYLCVPGNKFDLP